MFIVNPYIYSSASYIVDTYSAPVAFSVRKISSTATNCLRVRRDSDNAEQDIGFSGDDLDTSSLSSFVGANTGYVTKWYNQGTAGATYDAAMATAANQPRIVNAGTIDTKNSNNAIYFGGNNWLDSANNSDTLSVKPFMWSVVATQETANTIGYAFCNRDLNNTNSGIELNVDRRAFNDMVFLDTTNETATIDLLARDDTSNQRLITATCDNSWNVEGFKNGVSQNTTTLTAEPAPVSGVFSLGRTPFQSKKLTGYIQEAFIFTTDESSNRAAIESDINTYYSIY